MIFPIILITLGSFLEVYYYVTRFLADGAPLWLAIAEGSALSLLLQIVVYFAKVKSGAWLWVASLLVLYSVFCTAAGQQLSHADIQAQSTAIDTQSEITKKEIEEAEKRIVAIDVEYQAIQIPSDIETRAKYRTTVLAAEERKRELVAERRTYEAKLIELRAVVTGVVTASKDSYTWYASLFGGDPRVWQLVLQVILSILVAIMAPIGIYALPDKKIKQKNVTQNDFIVKKR